MKIFIKNLNPIKTSSSFNSKHVEHESKGDKDKALSIKEYPVTIRPYLAYIINNHKTQGKWKIHQAIQ